MPIHEEVLKTAVRLCRERGGWTFRADEIVRALPHLNERSVRTHIVSRCCTNAPKNHPHKWDYFRRIGRGIYEIREPYRKIRRGAGTGGKKPPTRPAAGVSEPEAPYSTHGHERPRETVHAIVHRDRGVYVAECLEVAVVTQGRSLDELAENLREALALHLEGEDPRILGVSRSPRLAITYETDLAADVPPG